MPSRSTASSSRIRSTSPQVAASSQARSRARATTPTAGNGTAHIGRWLKIVGSSSRPNPASSSSPGDLAPAFGSSAATVPRDTHGQDLVGHSRDAERQVQPERLDQVATGVLADADTEGAGEDAVEQRPEGDRVVAVRGSRFPVGLLLLECAAPVPRRRSGRREGRSTAGRPARCASTVRQVIAAVEGRSKAGQYSPSGWSRSSSPRRAATCAATADTALATENTSCRESGR